MTPHRQHARVLLLSLLLSPAFAYSSTSARRIGRAARTSARPGLKSLVGPKLSAVGFGGANGGSGGGRGCGPLCALSSDDSDDRERNEAAPRNLGLLAIFALPLVALIAEWSGVGRVLAVWLSISPILFAYAVAYTRLSLARASPAEREQTLRRLHTQNAPRLLKVINRMQGGYVKTGQAFSNRPDVLPAAYVTALSTLQDDVTPRPWREVQRVLERSLPGGNISRHFASIEPTPIGCASVAQVHRATLASDPQCTVVIKVQHARAKRLFRVDLLNIELLSRLAVPPLAPVVGEIRARFSTEFDFEREARNLELVGASMRRHFGSQVVVPRPLPGLSGPRVLVMDYLPGPKLSDALASDVQRAVGPRNFRRLRARARGDDETALALSTALSLAERSADQARMVLAAPLLWRIRLQVRSRLRTLVRAHGQQILGDGRFNGDPHGGNVLVTTTSAVSGGGGGLLRGIGSRRLGLIDYGQVRELSTAQRRCLAALIVSLADGESTESVARLFGQMGFTSAKNTPELASRIARIMFDRDDRSGKPAAVLRELAAIDSIRTFPLEYVMAARVSLLLRGLGLAFGVRLSTAQMWRPYALRCLQEGPGPP